MEAKRYLAFPMASKLSGFDSLVVSEMASALRRKRAELISLDNEFRYRHGVKWHSQLSYRPEDLEPAEMRAHSMEVRISFRELIDNDLSALQAYFDRFTSGMMDAFFKEMYQTINDTTEKTGNIVKGEGRGFRAEQFLEMLEKIEFGVDRDGNVALPQIHAGPGVINEMYRVLSSQGPEFEEQVDRIKQEKVKAALDREEERKARFPPPAGSSQ